MDPYCKVTVGTKTQKTDTKKNAGKTPEWNQALTFPFDGEGAIHFEVYDYDATSRDDLIGTTDFQMAAVLLSPQKSYRGELQLMRKGGTPAGYLKFSVEILQSAAAGGGVPPTQQSYAPMGFGGHQPQSVQPPMAYGGSAPPMYNACPPEYQPAPAYGAPPAQYGAPPAQYGAPPAQYGAPPAQYGAQYGGAPQAQYPPCGGPPPVQGQGHHGHGGHGQGRDYKF